LYHACQILPMKRLNGWQRIGVIASVLWILAAGSYTYISEFAKVSNPYVPLYVQCLSDAHDNRTKDENAYQEALRQCQKDLNKSSAWASSEARIVAAFVALVPVILGWAVAYLALFLTRWVRRGFAR
jgi:hypothetical protein